jgi:hypothetical protein
VATATAGCGPERTFAITHFIEIPGDSRINARRRGVAGAPADSGTAFRAGSLSAQTRGAHTAAGFSPLHFSPAPTLKILVLAC